MKNKHLETLKEYVRKLGDEDLHFLGVRLSQRMGGDVGDALLLMEDNQEVDRILSLTTCAEELYSVVDELEGLVQQESRRRFVFH